MGSTLAPSVDDPRVVATPLDADGLEAELRLQGIFEDWSHIINGIRNGFDVGIESQVPCTIVHPNHTSSTLDPDFISSYIQSEMAAGRYSRGFSQSELEELIGPFCTSPLGLVRKDVTSFRLIQDLSFPRRNDSVPSINSQVDSDNFPTEWGTFDITSRLLLSLPDGCQAATFDISSAYRITPVRPDQQWALVVHWDGQFYVDRALPFGLASSAGVFGSVADMLVALYNYSHKFGPMVKWVDDFFAILLPHQSWNEADFMQFTGRFGVPWSTKKPCPLNVIQRYIGFNWNLNTRSVSLPDEKKSAALNLINQWLAVDGKFTLTETLAFHGKLVFIASIFHLIRPYLPSVIEFSRTFRDPRSKLHVPRSTRRDIEWVRYLLQVLPNTMPLSLPSLVDLDWWGDASTSFGIGVVIGDYWAGWRWAPGFNPGPSSGFNIGWAEAVAVELGICLLIHLGLHHHSSSHRFLIRSDNQGVVEMVMKGRCRSRESNDVLKRIYHLLAEARISIKTEHIPSRDNVSDALSRGDIPSFLRAFPRASSQIHLAPPLPLASKLLCL